MARTVKVFNENNDFQRIEVLKRNREKRNRYGTFFVEGVKSIDRVVSYGWEVESLIYCGEDSLSKWAKDLLVNVQTERNFELTKQLMDKISDREESSEVIALVRIPEYTLDKVELNENFLVVICDRPSNPGNLGTIIRSSASFKANAVIVTGHSVDIYDPITIRSSVGALFSIPVFRVERKAELEVWFEKLKKNNKNVQVVGTTVKTDTTITEKKFTDPTVLFLGNETDGLSRGYKDMCDSMIKIPIYGTASSLNVGCAASICLYEIDRQRSL